MAAAFICCAVSRVTAPAVFSSLNAKGRDSLHEVDVLDRVCVHTVCGTCSAFTGKSPKLSVEIVLRRTKNPSKNPGLSEASLTCRDESCIREWKQQGHVEVRVYRISQVCNPPAPVRHRSPTRSQPVRGLGMVNLCDDIHG